MSCLPFRWWACVNRTVGGGSGSDTFTPSGAPGTVVRGSLYVDTVSDDIPPYEQATASEVAAGTGSAARAVRRCATPPPP